MAGLLQSKNIRSDKSNTAWKLTANFHSNALFYKAFPELSPTARACEGAGRFLLAARSSPDHSADAPESAGSVEDRQ
jgi:hypothetical protein